MQRLEIIIKFFLALASTVFLLIAGVVLPAAGVILIPFVPQPVLLFGLKYGAGLGVAVLVAAMIGLFLAVRTASRRRVISHRSCSCDACDGRRHIALFLRLLGSHDSRSSCQPN